MNKKQYKELLDAVCSEDCDNDNCFLRQFILSSHPSPRLLVQLRCVARYKTLIENLDCEKMTWAEVMEKWVSNNRAAKFAKVYDEDKTYMQIYKEIMNNEN